MVTHVPPFLFLSIINRIRIAGTSEIHLALNERAGPLLALPFVCKYQPQFSFPQARIRKDVTHASVPKQKKTFAGHNHGAL